MPFYEYECPHCRHHEEVLQSIKDKPLTKCPNCGKSGFKKLISAPVFRLKGSGWYETDFKSDKENKRNLAGADKDEAPKKDDDKKPDTKADAAKPEKSEKSEKSESAKPAPVKTSATRKPAKPAKRPPARKARR